MKFVVFVLLGAAFVPGQGRAATKGEVTSPIYQFIDGFNTGDINSAYAAYSDGEISIIDEFPPHRWVGPKAAQAWAADYEKHATATGVSDGHVACGKPSRTQIDSDSAYVIVPAKYTYKVHGRRTVEDGQMTFALSGGAAGWRIKSWTWTGNEPHAAR